MVWGLKKAYVIKLYLERLYCEFIAKTFKLYTSGKTSCTYAVFYTQYKSQKTLSKWGLL